MEEITIYDIAEKAGVSASTVSRVINNYPHVKPSTREKVMKLLKENNFTPNAAAQSLVTQSSKMVGILIADLRTTHHTDGIYYIEQELSKNGYSCLIYNTGTDPKAQAQSLISLSKKNIDAVVLMGSIYQNRYVADAIKKYLPAIPVAICNGYLDGKNIYGVVSDELNGVSECVKLLVERGKNNIAFILNHRTPSNDDKIRGFNLGFDSYSNGSKYILETGDSSEDIEEKTLRLLDEHPDINAIIFVEDYIAMIGMHAIISSGRHIPEDISVIGINNSRYAAIYNPPLTTLDNMLYDTSITTVRNLLMVLNGEHASKKMIIGTYVKERQST